MNIMSTGEMIDQLKVGSRAKVVGEDFIVIKKENGAIVWEDTEKYLVIDQSIASSRWEFEKIFLSFDEAMSHLKNDETVYFINGETTCELNSIDDMEDCEMKYIRWVDLFKGSFYIEE